MLPDLALRMAKLHTTRALVGQLPARGERVSLTGLPGSSGALLVAALTELLPQRTFLVVCSDPPDAEKWHADLDVLLGSLVVLYPQREALGEAEPHLEIAGERTESLEALLSGNVRVLVSTVPATAELGGAP